MTYRILFTGWREMKEFDDSERRVLVYEPAAARTQAVRKKPL